MKTIYCKNCLGRCYEKEGHYQCSSCHATVDINGDLIKVSKKGKQSTKNVKETSSQNFEIDMYSAFSTYSSAKKESSDKIEEEQNKIKVSKSSYAYVFVAIIYILAMYNKVSPVAIIAWLDEIVMNFAQVYFSRLAEILCYVYIFQAMVAFFAERMHGKDVSIEGGALKSLFANSNFQGACKVVISAVFMTAFFFMMPSIDEWLTANLGLQIADLMIFVMMAVPAAIMLGIKLLQIIVNFGDTFKFIADVIVMSINLLIMRIYILIAYNQLVNSFWLGNKCSEIILALFPSMDILAILLFFYYFAYLLVIIIASKNEGMAVIKSSGSIWKSNFDSSVFGGIGRIVISILTSVMITVLGSLAIDLLSNSISKDAYNFLLYLALAVPAYLVFYIKAWQLKTRVFDEM